MTYQSKGSNRDLTLLIFFINRIPAFRGHVLVTCPRKADNREEPIKYSVPIVLEQSSNPVSLFKEITLPIENFMIFSSMHIILHRGVQGGDQKKATITASR